MTNKNIKSDLTNKCLILCGAIAGLLFTFSWIIQEAFRESYNPMMIPISSLAIGSLGWIQTLTFLITGTLIILFAYGLWKMTKNEYNGVSKWGIILILVCAVGLIGAGCFTTDPMNGYPEGTPLVNDNPSFNSVMHQLFSSFLFFGLPIACFIFANYFTVKKELKLMIFSSLSGILFLILFLLTSLGFSQLGGLQLYAGLLQRITLTIGFLWIFLISSYFFKK